MPLPLIPLIGAGLGGLGIGALVSGMLGGKESVVTPTTTNEVPITPNQITNQYQLTVDSSYNVVYDSPAGSIKKGALGSQNATPDLDITPKITTETPIDLNQSSKQDTTGLVLLGIAAVVGFAIFKEVI